eukprot:scaffold25928_cov45-Cyclotella_meneghiniana.AAC.2
MRIIHAQFVMIDRIGGVDFLDEYSKEGRLGIVEGGDHLKGGEEGGVGQQAERLWQASGGELSLFSRLPLPWSFYF